jgi:hypothetical protein
MLYGGQGGDRHTEVKLPIPLFQLLERIAVGTGNSTSHMGRDSFMGLSRPIKLSLSSSFF